MLLMPTVQISRVDSGQGRHAETLFAIGFGEQLVIPQADRFECLAPDTHHTNALVAMLGEQMIDGNVLQHQVVRIIGVDEMLVHRHGALKQLDTVEPQECGRHQTDRGEHTEPATDPIGHAEDLVTSDFGGQVVQFATGPGYRDDQSAQMLAGITAQGGLQCRQELSKCSTAASMVPPLLLITTMAKRFSASESP